MRRQLVILAIAFAGSLSGPATNTAAQVMSEGETQRGPRFLSVLPNSNRPRAVDPASIPTLSKRISLSLEGVSRREAIAAIAHAAGIQLVYEDGVLPEAGAVRLVADRITVAAAMTEALLDAGVDMLMLPNGSAVLVRRTLPRVQLVGGISGRVTDSINNEGVAGATILVEGTRLSGTTSSDGSYSIRSVPVGEWRVVVRRLGYRSQSRGVAVGEGQTVTADFQLTRTPAVLTEVVATATGDRQRLEIGNAIGTIRADSIVPTTLVRNVSDLLQARTPGVVVTNTVGQVGAPSRIRLRGVNSMTLNNDPVIIVDGVRLEAQVTSAGSAGQLNTGASRITAPGALAFSISRLDDFSSSRLDDLDPNLIESIDVLRGPSATSLYGTEASNGVIVIRTKRGTAGSFRTSILADHGWSENIGEQPTIWSGWGHLADGTITATCNLTNTQSGTIGPNVTDGTCVQDSVTAFNPTNNPDQSTIGRGSARNLSVTMSGGSDRLRQFLSARASDNVGLLRMSNAEARRIERMWGTPPPSWMRRPNTEQTFNATSRTDLQPTPGLEFSVSANGTYRNILNGAPALAGEVGGLESFYRRYDTLAYLPSEAQRVRQQQVIKRGVATANLGYRPREWLALRGSIGGDYTVRTDELQQRVQDCTAALNPAGCTGARGSGTAQVFSRTADVGATLSFRPLPWMVTRTSLGEQYTRVGYYQLAGGNGLNTQLAFGSDLLTPAPVATATGVQLYTVLEQRDESATAGWYLEQMAGIQDRFFLTAGFRQDASSAFGEEVNKRAPIYPKYNVSWLISNEPFFPLRSVISSMRLRSAYGHSGKQAGQLAVRKNYLQANALAEDASPFGTTLVPGIRLLAVGNPELKPERTAELEGGVDIALFDGDRITVAASMYRKHSRDAIVQVGVPSSFGLSTAANFTALTQYVNVGSVDNRGTELSATARVLDSRRLTWDLTANLSQNRNKLLSVSPAATAGVTSGFKVGYPIFGWFTREILSYHDLNGDGILALSEVIFTDTTVFRGAPYPRRENSYQSDFAFLDGAVRIGALFNHVIGLTTATTNNLGAGSINTNNRCQFDRTCTFAEQAMSLQSRLDGAVSQATTLRFSELSVTWNMPQRVLGRARRMQSAAITLAGRNLHYWTTYYGKDPNIQMAPSLTGEVARDYGAGLAQPRNWTLRVNLGL